MSDETNTSDGTAPQRQRGGFRVNVSDEQRATIAEVLGTSVLTPKQLAQAAFDHGMAELANAQQRQRVLMRALGLS